MLTDVLTYRRQNQGLTVGDFTSALTDNTTCAIDFKAVFGDFTPSAPDFKAVLTLTLTEVRGFSPRTIYGRRSLPSKKAFDFDVMFPFNININTLIVWRIAL